MADKHNEALRQARAVARATALEAAKKDIPDENYRPVRRPRMMCKKQHALTGNNLSVRHNRGRIVRVCRTCENGHARRRKNQGA